MINTDLLMAADKFNVPGLLDKCARYFKYNLSLLNALDVLVAADAEINQGFLKHLAQNCHASIWNVNLQV